jgi:hypothetical protein
MIDASILLADAAQVTPDNKVQALGIGWDVLGVGNQHTVVVCVWVPWDQANIPQTMVLSLAGEDGQPVLMPDQSGGSAPLEVGRVVEVGRPAGVAHGVPALIPWVVNVGPGLPFTPGTRYVWRLSINDHSEDHWRRSFVFAHHPLPRAPGGGVGPTGIAPLQPDI